MLIQYMQEKRPEGLGNDGGKEEDVADLQVFFFVWVWVWVGVWVLCA